MRLNIWFLSFLLLFVKNSLGSSGDKGKKSKARDFANEDQLVQWLLDIRERCMERDQEGEPKYPTPVARRDTLNEMMQNNDHKFLKYAWETYFAPNPSLQKGKARELYDEIQSWQNQGTSQQMQPSELHAALMSHLSPAYGNPASNSPASSASSDRPPDRQTAASNLPATSGSSDRPQERQADSSRRQYFDIPDVDQLEVFPLEDLEASEESPVQSPSQAPTWNLTDRTWIFNSLDPVLGEERVQMSLQGSIQISIVLTFLIFFMIFFTFFFIFYISKDRHNYDVYLLVDSET